MIIQEGDKMPIGYGFVKVCWKKMNAFEVLPIPICWLKRFWYWTLHKTKLFNWEKELTKKQKENWEKITRILDNLDKIYIRAEINKKWENLSLKEFIQLNEEKQVIKWIKETLKDNK